MFRNLVKSIRALWLLGAIFLSSCLTSESDAYVIEPGVDIAIVDAYLSQSTYFNSINIVFRNTNSWPLPYFQMDYFIQCDSGEKIYKTEAFHFNSNEQISKTFSVDQNATSCQFTINTIRPHYEPDYDDWTGNFQISVN